jgi:Mtf2 family
VTKQRPLDEIPWDVDPQETANSESQSLLSVDARERLVAKDKDMTSDTNGRADVDILLSNSSRNDQGIYERGSDTNKLSHKPTITLTEKIAFERIFADITNCTGRNNPSNTGRMLNLSPKPASRAGPSELLSTTKTTQDLMNAIGRYPPSLRAAAARAVGLSRDQRQEQREPTADTKELEDLRQSELKRVEELMRAATTDAKLWQVMEREVFSLIGKLGFGEGAPVRDEIGAGRSKRERESADESGTSKNELLDVAVYGSLYPLHLLAGLRLLDLSFSKPSLLALNVLPRIKSLGLISHVLGASTALYNELLHIYCFRYDNFAGAVNLLIEMEQSGLEFDAETLAVVEKIAHMQRDVLYGDSRSSLKELWSMPEFVPGKFEEWKGKIQASLTGEGSGNMIYG